MCSPSAPAGPDLVGAAKTTADLQLKNDRIATKANRVNTYTPYGSLTFKQGTGFDQAGYDAAMQKYSSDLANAKNSNTQNYDPLWTDSNGDHINPNYQQGWGQVSGANWGQNKNISPPNREDFMNGDPDSWNANINLSPTGQALLDQQDKTSLGLGNLQDAATQRVAQTVNTPYASVYDPARDTNKAQQQINSNLQYQPGAYDPRKSTNDAQAQIMSRLEPQFNRDQAALETQLANQGLNRDSEAYKNALSQFGQTKNDAYTQAALQGINLGAQQQAQQFQQGLSQRQAALQSINLGGQQQQQQYQQQLGERQMPLNELNAIRTGSQVTNPTFQNFAPQASTPGPNILGSTNAEYANQLAGYNAQSASQNGMVGGLFSLGAGLLGGPAGSLGAQLGSRLLGK